MKRLSLMEATALAVFAPGLGAAHAQSAHGWWSLQEHVAPSYNPTTDCRSRVPGTPCVQYVPQYGYPYYRYYR